MNLSNVLKHIKEEMVKAERDKNIAIRQAEGKYKERMEELEKAYKVNTEMNTACLKCDGRGEVVHFGTYQQRDSTVTCSKCGGTGKIQNKGGG